MLHTYLTQDQQEYIRRFDLFSASTDEYGTLTVFMYDFEHKVYQRIVNERGIVTEYITLDYTPEHVRAKQALMQMRGPAMEQARQEVEALENLYIFSWGEFPKTV